MSLPETLAVIFAVLASICVVTGIILLGKGKPKNKICRQKSWFLIWKTFLSKFRLVQELLGHTDIHENTACIKTGSGGKNKNCIAQGHTKTKKLRKD